MTLKRGNRQSLLPLFAKEQAHNKATEHAFCVWKECPFEPGSLRGFQSFLHHNHQEHPSFLSWIIKIPESLPQKSRTSKKGTVPFQQRIQGHHSTDLFGGHINASVRARKMFCQGMRKSVKHRKDSHNPFCPSKLSLFSPKSRIRAHLFLSNP